MDKDKLKDDFKSLINNISNEVINSSIFKLLEKIKKEISELSKTLTDQISSFSKISSEVPGKIEEKLGKFDELQNKASDKITKNSEKLRKEIDRMVENNYKLETNFNNNFYQLQENNELLRKKLLDLTKLVNILIIIIAFSAIGIVVTILQNQKIIKLDRSSVETIQEVTNEIADLENYVPEDEDEQEQVEESIPVSNESLTRISKNSKEINKLWNSYSKLNNRVNSILSTAELEDRFETRFSSVENRITAADTKIGNVEISFYEKLDNIWAFLEENGTTKMRKAIGGE